MVMYASEAKTVSNNILEKERELKISEFLDRPDHDPCKFAFNTTMDMIKNAANQGLSAVDVRFNLSQIFVYDLTMALGLLGYSVHVHAIMYSRDDSGNINISW